MGAHDVGDLFNLVAGTEQDRLNGEGNLAGNPIGVSSVQDFAAQLVGNGPITGGVIYVGHGGSVPYPDGFYRPGLAPGEQSGPNTNIGTYNLSLLLGRELMSKASVTLRACQVGYGGYYSFAKYMATQLNTNVYAPEAGMFFSLDPNSKASGAPADTPAIPLNATKPIYLLQAFGKPLKCFSPLGSPACQ